MKKITYIRLSFMMLLQYFVWGSWYVTMGTYLGTTLQFDGIQIGSIYGAGAIAAIVSPFFVGLIADNLFATQKVLGVLHLIGAALMYFTTTVSEFWIFYAFLLAYTLAYFPTLALTNGVCFRQMEDPEQQFPWVRVWGTVGWIVAGFFILGMSRLLPGLENIEETSVPLRTAAISSLVMGVYSFTLPNTPPNEKPENPTFAQIIGLDALYLLKDRSFLVMFIASVLICIPLMFYYSFTNLFFNEVGLDDAAFKMTFGQMSEILFMLVMPFFFARLGVKWMVAVGMVAWVLRYALFALGNPDELVWMFYGGIVLHGICYDFFFVTGQIYADNKSPAHLRSSVQGMMTFATYGLGFFIGSFISGAIVSSFTAEDGTHDWVTIWMNPAMFALVVLLFFVIMFNDKSADKRKEPADLS